MTSPPSCELPQPPCPRPPAPARIARRTGRAPRRSSRSDRRGTYFCGASHRADGELLGQCVTTPIDEQSHTGNCQSSLLLTPRSDVDCPRRGDCTLAAFPSPVTEPDAG